MKLRNATRASFTPGQPVMLKRAGSRLADHANAAPVYYKLPSRPPRLGARSSSCTIIRTPPRSRRHFASQVLPATSVGTLQPRIPYALQDLHARLKTLEANSAAYVEGSRLKLALRSLEKEDAVVRIAGM